MPACRRFTRWLGCSTLALFAAGCGDASEGAPSPGDAATIGAPDAATADAARDDARAEDVRSQDVHPDDAHPDDARPDDAHLDDAHLDDARPDDARPDDARPDDARPDDARPDDARAEDTRAEDTPPARDTGPAPAAGAPVVFFSDITDGPGSGGEGDRGAFVTIHGARFGAARGSSRVSIGGGDAAAYPVWTDAKLTFQLGPGARSGAIVVHTERGDSNGVAFRVRAGRIHFVAAGGTDAGDGAFASPWRTLAYAVDHMEASGLVYVRDGVTDAGVHHYDAAVYPTVGGAADAWAAILAYPGARATIGADGHARSLMFDGRLGTRSLPYVVVGGLTIRGTDAVVIRNLDWLRFVGNEITCPNGDGATGCVEGSATNHVAFYGNHVFDAGRPQADKLYHGVYFSTDSNHIDIGWNHVENVRGCRGIQFHSSPLQAGDGSGKNQFDLAVHDNLVHGTGCDGINFATVDPSQGAVRAFNNVIYDVGHGWYRGDSSSYACVLVAGITNTGAPGTGTVEVFNNTCVGYGLRGAAESGSQAFAISGRTGGLALELRNNVAVSTNGAPYFSSDTAAERVRGSHNLWWGAGPGALGANIDADPRFVNAAGGDYRLAPGSPAIDSGVDTMLARDIAGYPRTPPLDRGAFEASARDGPATGR